MCVCVLLKHFGRGKHDIILLSKPSFTIKISKCRYLQVAVNFQSTLLLKPATVA